MKLTSSHMLSFMSVAKSLSIDTSQDCIGLQESIGTSRSALSVMLNSRENLRLSEPQKCVLRSFPFIDLTLPSIVE